MASRWAVASGNWSNTATWNGGTLPATGDDVSANGFTVTIDQDINMLSLRIDANGSAVQGGGFVVSAGTRSITLSGSMAVGAHTGSSTAILLLSGGAVTLSVAVNMTGDTSNTGTEPPCVLVTGGTHTITVSGSIVGSASTAAFTMQCTGGTTTLNATMTGGAGTGGVAVDVSGSAQATINGAVTGGGSATGSYGLNVGSGAAVTLRGDLKPGSYSSSGNGSPAVLSSGVLRYSGHIYSGGMFASTGPNGFMPLQGNWSAISGEEVYLHVYDDGNYPSGNNGTQRILTRYGTDLPVAADVRSGTAYGPSGVNVGTLSVPPAASVAAGVPTDDTVGTAALALSDVLAGTGAQIAAATSG